MLGISKIIKGKYSKDFIKFSLGYFFCALLSLFITALVNKELTSYEIGLYSYNKSLFELLAAVISLTLYTSYLRFNTKGINKKLGKIVLVYVFIAIAILFLIYLILSKSVYASLYCFVVLYNERSYFFRSIFDTNRLNTLRIAAAFVTLSLIIVTAFMMSKALSASDVLFYYAIGYMLAIPFLYVKKQTTSTVEDGISIKDILKYCIPGALMVIVDWIFVFSSQHIIKEHYGFEELAPFAISQRAMLAIKLVTGLYLMYYPTLYFKEIEKGNYSLIKKSRRLILLSLMLFITICYLSTNYIYILIGAGAYLDSISYFRILLVAEFFKVAASLYGLYLSYKLQTIQNFLILLLGTVCNILIIYFYIEEIGVVVACISSVIAYFIVLILIMLFSYRKEKEYLLLIKS